MFSLLPRTPTTEAGRAFSLARMQAALQTKERLAAREQLTPDDLTAALLAREQAHGFAPFQPRFTSDKLYPGTYYLHEINAQSERVYRRKPLDAPVTKGGALLPSLLRSVSFEAVGVSIDGDSGAVTPRNESSNVDSNVRSGIPRNSTYVWPSGRPNVSVVVTGIAAALPTRDDDDELVLPSAASVRRIVEGESFLSHISDTVKEAMLDKNVADFVKGADGALVKKPIVSKDNLINVRAKIGHKFSLTSYGVSESIVGTMDRAVQVSIAAGLEALKDAGIVNGEGPGTKGWELPASMQNTTGVVYATSFPALDTAVEEVTKYFKTKSVDSLAPNQLVTALRNRLEKSLHGDALSQETEDALKKLEEACQEASNVVDSSKYEFDRKFLFRVLVLGNAQLAQIIKARGPNMQTNAACAGATQAIALAYDMIQVGRAERVIVIAGDAASSDNLMPWLGNGFRSLGAATTCSDLYLAAKPFSAERSGMIMGSGGIGMVLESEEGAKRRYALRIQNNPIGLPPTVRGPFRCKLLATLVSNSAYHGASMDREHIAQEMIRFLNGVEETYHLSRAEIAKHGVYFSHETSTHSSPTSACAANEVYALRKAFGEHLKDLMILNTKGFTGHPMGVSFEDVVAAEVLVSGRIPPVANFTAVDPVLGDDLKISRGGNYPVKYAMRFAAGFGSQIALALYGAANL
eukprot:scaffold9701_cov265-Ochromonas_danica.AAC.6